METLYLNAKFRQFFSLTGDFIMSSQVNDEITNVSGSEWDVVGKRILL